MVNLLTAYLIVRILNRMITYKWQIQRSAPGGLLVCLLADDDLFWVPHLRPCSWSEVGFYMENGLKGGEHCTI